jgi:acyl carrier protein
MTEREKLALLEDMFEMEEGELSPDMKLKEVEAWDSMMMLSLIVLMNDEFGKKLTGDEIDGFETIGDVIACMN